MSEDNENGPQPFEDPPIIETEQPVLMELHHPHHVTHKKKWSEYFLEFSMLFFAVFLGFIAENIRETYVEHHREKDYIHSLVNDLKTDVAKLNRNIKFFEDNMARQDSLLNSLFVLDKGFTAVFYRNLGTVTAYPDFIYTDATIQQLKNSGGFRLFRNQKDIDMIMNYDAMVKAEQLNEGVLGNSLDRIVSINNELLNYKKYKEQVQSGKSMQQMEAEKFDFLLTHDDIALSKYYNHLLYYIDFCKIVKGSMGRVRSAAENLISFLEKEYNLE